MPRFSYKPVSSPQMLPRKGLQSIDWSFPEDRFVGKQKYEKAVRRATWWSQRQTGILFKACANGEVAAQGFDGHIQVVSLSKLDDSQRQAFICLAERLVLYD